MVYVGHGFIPHWNSFVWKKVDGEDFRDSLAGKISSKHHISSVLAMETYQWNTFRNKILVI